jgi:hypothetical protein
MKRLLFLAHRWLGIVLCLLLLLWSFSGLMMMYAGPSGISPDVRWHTASHCRQPAGRWLSLSEARQRSGLAATRQPQSARLSMQAGEAVWLVTDTPASASASPHRMDSCARSPRHRRADGP